jgi:membrane associated rhomboid family serine protease
VPSIGASGSIAGVLGAFLLLRPAARIVTLFPLVVSWALAEIPAIVFLPLWFAMQFLNGYESIGDRSYTGGGVAWFAHIGGFIAGMLLIKLFPSRQRWRHWYEES